MNAKKLFSFVVIICLFASTMFAQEALKKGIYSLGGSVTFAGSTNELELEKIKSTDILILPSITYFIIDNLSLALDLGFGYNEISLETDHVNQTHISRDMVIGPVIRYYFSSSRLIPFIEAGYRYSNSLSGNNDMNTYSLAGGINYFLSKSVALEPYVEYSKTNYIVGDQNISRISGGIRVSYFIVD